MFLPFLDLYVAWPLKRPAATAWKFSLLRGYSSASYCRRYRAVNVVYRRSSHDHDVRPDLTLH
jgi:hypothetical protein